LTGAGWRRQQPRGRRQHVVRRNLTEPRRGSLDRVAGFGESGLLQRSQGHVGRQCRAVGGGRTQRVSGVNLPRAVRALAGGEFAGGLFERLTIFDAPGFKGSEQRGRELNVGEPLVAESGIALIVVPSGGVFDPHPFSFDQAGTSRIRNSTALVSVSVFGARGLSSFARIMTVRAARMSRRFIQKRNIRGCFNSKGRASKGAKIT